ncbi:DDE-type integrase/transposase/recombinase, partial [Propionibacterium australiense]
TGWVGDITYVPTWQGFAYLAVVMDCFSKKIVGHAIAGHMRTELVTEALAMAAPGLPTHSRCHDLCARTEAPNTRRPNTRNS